MKGGFAVGCIFLAKISFHLVCRFVTASFTPPSLFSYLTTERNERELYIYIGEVRIRPQFTNFYRAPPVDKWFHAAAVWKKNSKEVFLFIDGQKVGTESGVPSYVKFKEDFPSTFDIGLKRDGGHSLIGHLRDLMIIGRHLTGEELTNMEGEKLLTL